MTRSSAGSGSGSTVEYEAAQKDRPEPGPNSVAEHASSEEEDSEGEIEQAPPLPQDSIPPLPSEAPPSESQDDGWDPVWDDSAQAYYFYNRFSGVAQWTNPRVPDPEEALPPGVGSYDRIPKAPGTTTPPPERPPRAGGYDPAIHGDYDPTAPYAQEYHEPEENAGPGADPSAIYAATGTFNRFTGKWQATDINPENHNDENKSKRQMNAYFDVDAAANSHNGKSLKAERSGKRLTKQELKEFKQKRKEKKEEKRRAWLRD
ncbi:hypothetical protein XANCAGTX0491_009488 [Xanthoria calcicola]